MLTKKLVNKLINNQLFEGIDADIIRTLDEAFFEVKTFKNEVLIMEENSESEEMFLISSGSVSIQKNASNGDKVELFQRKAGDCVGEFSLLEKKSRSASVYSSGDTELIRIKKDDFFSILEKIPKVEYNIAKIITSKMRESDDKTISEIDRNLELIRMNKTIESQKVKLEKQKTLLQEANAMKDKFFSIIAHDLKNPLSAMIGFSDLLKNNYGNYSEDEKISFIDAIDGASKNLLQLLENLLEWSMSQTGKIKFTPKKIDIHQLAQANIDLLSQNANIKNIQLYSSIKPNTFVYADEDMITTVLRNLLTNSIKFTNSQGTVFVDAKNQDNFIQIAVHDTGVGIEMDVLPKLFRIDVHHTTYGTDMEEGTGLGLILCKEFVRKHGGEMQIESKEGKGSIFRFTLCAEKN